MKKRFIFSSYVKLDEQQFYSSVSKDSSRSIAFQPVVNNQKTEIRTVNNQEGTNDTGILPNSTAKVDEATHTERTLPLLIPTLTDNENLVNQVTSEKTASKKPKRLGNPI